MEFYSCFIVNCSIGFYYYCYFYYTASAQGISNYATVFPNEMLLEMASSLPATREELLQIPQCTDYKLNCFNAESSFLEITLNYLSILGGKIQLN